MIEGIGDAIQEGNQLLAGYVAQASLRREQAVRRAGPTQPLSAATLAAHRKIGEALCRDSVRMLRSEPPALRGPVEISIVDDDAGGPYPLPARSAFQAELERLGVEVRPGGARIVLLFADVKSWKGRAGLSAESADALAAQLATPAQVVLFGHPRRQTEIPGVGPVMCAWSGDEAMQRAAAQRMVG